MTGFLLKKPTGRTKAFEFVENRGKSYWMATSMVHKVSIIWQTKAAVNTKEASLMCCVCYTESCRVSLAVWKCWQATSSLLTKQEQV